jgi:DNA-binding transcriptional MerR regulator
MDSGAIYRGALVAQVAGVPLRTLQRWIVDGLAPCAKDVKGTGNKRRFTFGDIVRARALGELRTKGADVRTLKRAVAILAAEYGEADPLGGGRLVVLQGRVYWREDDKGVVDLLRGQRVIKDLILVDMGELAQETRAKVQALAA